MTTYTVRLEHGRRRQPHEYALTEQGHHEPAYLHHPAEVSYSHVDVDDFDEHGNLRHDAEMEQEARNVAVWMHHDRPGRPTDMVTKADIIGAIA